MMKRVVQAGIFVVLGGASVALASAADIEARMSVAGVQAVEDHWSKAFVGGDAAYLDHLLAPDYVSVNPKGVPRPKADIIALAKKYAATNPAPLPPRPQSPVSVQGDTAIVRHRSAEDVSVDIFYYRGGAWHAWYSQHTTPGK